MPARFQPNPALEKDLAAILPPDRISQGAADRLTYSRDMWPKTLLALQDNKPSVRPPDIVVWPESTDEVAEIVRLAGKHAAPLVPYGGGSGVCGGAMATSGGIIIDLKRMNRLVDLSVEDSLATFESGILGQSLEDQLNLRGLTLGHFPASIYCSTLGGWVATRSAGQMSSKYGKIEDMVYGLEAVLGDGRVVQCTTGQEPDLIPLLVGSEGTLGIITRVTAKVSPLPDYRLFRAYEFPRVAAGCEAMRRILQRGLRPAVMRLYDELDTLIVRHGQQRSSRRREGALSLMESVFKLIPQAAEGLNPDLKGKLFRTALSRAGMINRVAKSLIPRLSGACLAIYGFEGEPSLTEAEAALCHAECLAAGAKDLGEGPAIAWYEHRYSISYMQSPVFAGGAMVDTMEVATTWERVMDLYQEVRQALSSQAIVLAHFSHAYHEGCTIYFTFAASADGRIKADNLYDDLWRRGLGAVVKVGGTISHHHGIGQSKAAYMQQEHGASMAIMHQLKQVMDPQGILNPGKMGL